MVPMLWIALLPTTPPDAQPDLAAVEAWGWHALRFTPRVSLQSDAVLLEVAASLRLFGGVRPLLSALLTPSDTLLCAVPAPCPSRASPGVPDANAVSAAPALAAWAHGPTAWVALGRARDMAWARPGTRSINARHAARPLDQLPLATLDAARPHLDTLARLGCQTWGDLRRLPRDGVARRFGQALLDALDMACGDRPDTHPWLVWPERFATQVELDALVYEAPALLFAARRLLARLRVWLAAQGAGVRSMRWVWHFDARRGTDPHGEFCLHLSEPTQAMEHPARLLAEHWARTVLPVPVHTLGLEALAVEPLPGSSHSLLIEERAQGDTLAQLVERLSARLGPGQVRRWQPADSPVPERRQRWSAALARPAQHDSPPSVPPARYAAPAPVDGLWPTWLLDEPLPLAVRGHRPHYQGPLSLLVGPQRLEASGWPGQGGAAGLAPAMRDYFIARSERAGLLWVYRQRLDAQAAWFLHGIFA